jgi:cytochrome c556
MKFAKKIIISIGVSLSVAFSFLLQGHEQPVPKKPLTSIPTASNSISLRSVMQGLLIDTQQLSEGIFLEDFAKIKAAAKNIADHPAPAMANMKKVKGYLGTEMVVFKGFDIKVHNTALTIANSANEQDMSKIISGYHQLIDGCQSCHAQFKQRVSKILNPD